MKLSIILGWAKTDASGNPVGAPKIVSAPPEDDAAARAQAAQFSDAKSLHKFPKGIAHLAFGEISINERASFISDDLAEQMQGRQQVQFEQVQSALKQAEADKQKRTAIQDASARLSKAAVVLNNASASLQTAKHRLLDAEANFKATKAESHKAEIEAGKARVAELAKAEAAAREELNAAKAAKADALTGTHPQPPILGT